jgi:carboxypeptidase T
VKTTLIAFLFLFVSAASAQVSTNRKYSDVITYMQKLAAQNPKTVRLFTMGYSDQGVGIQGMMIGDGPVNNLLVAAHHGNEYGSTELALFFAESLAAQPIENQTMYIIPVLNIEGYNNRNRHERVNGRYIDLNRDYPGPCGSDGPFFSRSSKALADLLDTQKIVTAATIHTYWPTVVWPWGLSSHDLDTPYTPIFMKLAQTAAEHSNYQIGNSAEVIYPADGTFEDYAFWKHGIWSLLFEVGKNHYPGIQDLNNIVKMNVPGIRKMFETAPRSRASQHEFTGQCNMALKALDLRIE